MPINFPHNHDAEQSVLGGVILRNAVLADLGDLEVEDFHDLRHKVVFGAMRALEARSEPIDIITLELEIQRAEKIDAVGGPAYLGQLALRVPTADNVVTYARRVRELHALRRMILTCAHFSQRAQEEDCGDDPAELIDEAVENLSSLVTRRTDDSATVGDLTLRRIKSLEPIMLARDRGENALTGIPTGVEGLDRLIGGWNLGICNLLAARPAMGKSAMAMASTQAATKAGHGAHVFSLEDAWTAYADRVLARLAGIPASRIRTGDLSRQDLSAIMTAQAQARQWKRWRVDNSADRSAADVVREVRRHRKELDTKLVVVDYAHLVRRQLRKGMTEDQALAEIVTTFAQAAKQDELAYLVLAQLNRDVEKRYDRRPVASDLRGSGAFEERSKVVVAMYRGAAYREGPRRGVDYECNCQGERCAHTPNDEQFEQHVQLLVLKNNQGEPGTVWARWHGPTTEIY